MTRYAHADITSKIQVLDSAGNPANNATVNWKIYDPSNELWDDGTMTYITGSNGLYRQLWHPNLAGEWIFEAYCSNPKFHQSFAYHVTYFDALVWTFHKNEEWEVPMWPPPSNWANLLEGEGGIRPYIIQFWWDNDEHGPARTFSISVIIDGIEQGNQQDLETNTPQHTYYLKLNANFQPQFVCDADDEFTTFGPTAGYGSPGGGIHVSDNPFECHTIVIKICFDDIDGAGTNPVAYASVFYQTLDPVTYGEGYQD